MDVNAKLAEEDAAREGVVQQGMAEMVPMAREGLKPKIVNALADVLVSTAETLSGGELGDVSIEPVSAPVEQLPADLASKIFAIAEFVRANAEAMPALAPYQFDPAELLTSNAGLDELQGILGGLGSDPAVRKAMRTQAPPPEEEGEEDMQADEMTAEEV